MVVVLRIDLDPGDGERARRALALGVDAHRVAEGDGVSDVVRRDVGLQPELGEHGRGVEVADDLGEAVRHRVVVDQVDARQRDGAAGRRAAAEAAVTGPSGHAVAVARAGPGGVRRGPTAHDLEREVGEAGHHASHACRERVAVEGPAGGRVLVGAVRGERRDDGGAVAGVPPGEVAVERIGECHAQERKSVAA